MAYTEDAKRGRKQERRKNIGDGREKGTVKAKSRHYDLSHSLYWFI